eukprot:scaffold218_cov67-Phaeocystis_antarctica.AAC.6
MRPAVADRLVQSACRSQGPGAFVQPQQARVVSCGTARAAISTCSRVHARQVAPAKGAEPRAGLAIGHEDRLQPQNTREPVRYDEEHTSQLVERQGGERGRHARAPPLDETRGACEPQEFDKTRASHDPSHT